MSQAITTTITRSAKEGTTPSKTWRTTKGKVATGPIRTGTQTQTDDPTIGTRTVTATGTGT